MDGGKTARCCYDNVFTDSRSYHGVQCSRKATTEHDGKPYCKTHNPALKKAKSEAQSEKWREQWAAEALARTKSSKRTELYPKLIDCLTTVETYLREESILHESNPVMRDIIATLAEAKKYL